MTDEQIELRWTAGAINLGEDAEPSDLLVAVLRRHFDKHPDRPEDDLDDEELGWSPWVMSKANAALDRIVAEIRETLSR